MLYEETQGDAIITTGVGQHQMWAAQYYKFKEPRRWATSGGLGSMGFGLPSGGWVGGWGGGWGWVGRGCGWEGGREGGKGCGLWLAVGGAAWGAALLQCQLAAGSACLLTQHPSPPTISDSLPLLSPPTAPLPAALGAAAAFDGKNGRPHKIVVDIDGDGSFVMNCQELATVSVEKLDTKCFILNNQYLGMVMQWEDRFYKANRAHTYLGGKVGWRCGRACLLWGRACCGRGWFVGWEGGGGGAWVGDTENLLLGPLLGCLAGGLGVGQLCQTVDVALTRTPPACTDLPVPPPCTAPACREGSIR